MSTNPLNFGIIGCGVIAPTHAAAIQATAGAQLVGVYDPDSEKARTLAERYDVPHFSHLAQFLELPSLDAVNICVPSGHHATVGIQAARAGKHVLVEKPLDVSLQAADALIDACASAGVKLGVISQHRFAPDVVKVKAAIDSGLFGPLVLGDAAIKWYRTQAYYDSGTWRGTWGLDGGGALMNQGIHYIDLLQWLMGPVVSVKAATLTRTHQIEVEDVGVAIVRFASGAIGTITGSTSIYPGLPERLEIHGRDATALIELDVLQAYYLRSELGDVSNYGLHARGATHSNEASNGGAANPAAISANLHAVQLADFVDAIHTNRAPAVSGKDARRPLELILAIYRSATEGVEVALSSSDSATPVVA